MKDKPQGYVFGRPTKYDPKYCDMLIKHQSQGLSFKSFSAVIGISRSTLYKWAEDNKDFSDTKDAAAACGLLFWEKLGVGGVAGKIKNFNASTWIYNMKCRHPEDWIEKTREDASNTIHTVKIQLPGEKAEQIVSMEPKKEGEEDE